MYKMISKDDVYNEVERAQFDGVTFHWYLDGHHLSSFVKGPSFSRTRFSPIKSGDMKSKARESRRVGGRMTKLSHIY